MDFGLLPPEVNSGLMYTGPGAGPMLAAAASWDAIAAQLESAASGCSSAPFPVLRRFHNVLQSKHITMRRRQGKRMRGSSKRRLP
jgi:hypothetical protein